LGQKRTCAAQRGMSALPPKADIRPCLKLNTPSRKNYLTGRQGCICCRAGHGVHARTCCRVANDGVFEAAPVVLEEPDIALFNLAAPLESRQCVAGETLVVLEAPGAEVGGGFI
jgi:hypothetical protein